MAKRTTIREVAEAANVSTATVSRYLNGTAYVNDETSSRIRSAIERTGYTPSLLARSLKTRQSGLLFLIVPDVSNPFYARIARTLQHLAQRSGYATLLSDSEGDPKHELEALETASKMSVEGVLLASIDASGDVLASAAKAAFPVVGLNGFAQDAPIDAVAVHALGGTHLAVDHLAALGHRRIAFAGGRPGTFIARSRLNGYLNAMRRAELPVNGEDVLEFGFTQADGRTAGAAFAQRRVPPTAVCCANDLIALGVIAALRDAGLRVPENVSVTGMDDIDYAALSSPPLTTVSNDPECFAERAFAMLTERIHGDRSPVRREEIPNALVVRHSTARPQ